jgi:glycosyltransferase involved in cell wall biosynthesis
MTRINVVPPVSGVGGMVSFQRRFCLGLAQRGIEAALHFNTSGSNALLVVGGTRSLVELLRAKRAGTRVVQRLNGMNWLHRKLKTGVKHFLRAEYGNLLLRVIRRNFCDHIVYQSRFAKEWWERRYGDPGTAASVIYNGVDLAMFSPARFDARSGNGDLGNCRRPVDRFRILMVEGSLKGGYELGLETGIALLDRLNSAYSRVLGRPVELLIAGQVTAKGRTRWSNKAAVPPVWVGLVDSDDIPCLDSSAHLLFSADINAACPNAVIEALACGTPVLGFATGALPEMIASHSGAVVPYGGDPWKLEKPDIPALAEGAVLLLQHQETYRPGARQRAEQLFDLDQMVQNYLDVLLAA